MKDRFLSHPVQPDIDGPLACIGRKGTPRRVYTVELFLDAEVQSSLVRRFGLAGNVNPDDPFAAEMTQVRLMRFLGYESVRCKPDGMCVATGGMFHFCEYLVWLMGYETLCYAPVEARDLVRAICDRVFAFYREALGLLLSFPKVRMLWASDDMGFRTGTLISPSDLRELVLPGRAMLARMTHAAGRLYILHSCGNLAGIMDDLIVDVVIDAKHSFEDTIQTVEDARRLYGSRIAVLGGIDVDFLCRSNEQWVCDRTRRTIERCMPGGGWCLGTGNIVANYIPLDN